MVGSVYARRTTTPIRMRSRADVEAFFDGYDMVDPGLTFVGEWRPVGADQPEFAGNPRLASILAGVGKLR